MSCQADVRDARPGEIFALLGEVWPALPATLDAAVARGLDWERCSTPFVHREGGRVVAHVGVLELPLVIAGRPRRVAGIHAVACHPDHRRQGHIRRLMEAALAFVDERYETAVLTASEPELYRRFGFEVVPEHRFVGRIERRGERLAPARDLEPGNPDDLALLHRALRDRAPVSQVLGVTRELPVFLFNTARQTLRHSGELGAILVATVEDGTLHLFDVVAPRIATLAEIVAVVPEPADRVAVYFGPDRLGAALEPEPWIFGGDELLMARGLLLAEGVETCLPRTARC